ncbi:hypothetical protein [Kitasatospora purpeofusca]|uniref:hypothetical protein n=1 Tax=Kitasatospora purpeofusca TaxID=67352 RepID=UPI00368652B3
MTATAVGDTTVIEDTPSLSPLSRPGKKPIYFHQIRHLLMSDGTELYGCAHCTYTSPKIGAVRPHLKSHKKGAAPKATPAKPNQLPPRTATAQNRKTTAPVPKRPVTAHRGEDNGTDLTTSSLAQLNLGELVTQAQQADAMRKQRDLARKERDAARSELDSVRADADKQRTRADEAEAKLAQVRRTLQL